MNESMPKKASSKKPKKASKPKSNTKKSTRTSQEVLTPERKANITQIHRAKGQVEGIERMILADRYCVEIITQITAARASLFVVSKSLLTAHLKACHEKAINNGGTEIHDMYQELVFIVEKMSK